VLLLPSTPLRATPIGARQVDAPDGTQVEVMPSLLSLTLPFNLLGWPALSVPAPEVTGLPIGVQLVALPGRDQAMLATAATVSYPVG
jgi:aspartyl-tRNA(Asn)/glutamyl-tRNA(Gln) amidotransferase subunit A